jgi:hypothetical protein
LPIAALSTSVAATAVAQSGHVSPWRRVRGDGQVSAEDRPDDSGSTRRQEPEAEDGPLRALDELVRAAEAMSRTMAALSARAEVIRQGRANGLTYREIVRTGEPPLIAGSLTPSIEQLESAGRRFRQAQARALRAEGMTMEQIAQVFGLSRQRISALLASGQHERPGSSA